MRLVFLVVTESGGSYELTEEKPEGVEVDETKMVWKNKKVWLGHDREKPIGKFDAALNRDRAGTVIGVWDTENLAHLRNLMNINEHVDESNISHSMPSRDT